MRSDPLSQVSQVAGKMYCLEGPSRQDTPGKWVGGVGWLVQRGRKKSK